MITLTTARLILRPLHLLDALPLAALFGDAEVMRFGDGAQDARWVERWVRARIIEQTQGWGFGRYAVVERERKAVIGYCGLSRMPDINGRPEVELGYRLLRSAWGAGYATEAALAVRDHAFDVLCLSRLVALIDPGNSASVKVAMKLGMRHEADVMLEGYTHPDHVYVASASTLRV